MNNGLMENCVLLPLQLRTYSCAFVCTSGVSASVPLEIPMIQIKFETQEEIMNTREANYIVNNFNEVLHTTFNPNGPRVVRLYLIP
jgi:hypothetical protein